jgi:heme oxygenase
VAGNTLDLQKIELRVDGFEYGGVAEFIADMQQMLKSVVQHFSYRHEVINSYIMLILSALCYFVCEMCPKSKK